MTEEEMVARASKRRSTARVRAFDTLGAENEAEFERIRRMSTQERIAELESILARVFGVDWKTRPIEKVWSYEIVDWL